MSGAYAAGKETAENGRGADTFTNNSVVVVSISYIYYTERMEDYYIWIIVHQTMARIILCITTYT